MSLFCLGNKSFEPDRFSYGDAVSVLLSTFYFRGRMDQSTIRNGIFQVRAKRLIISNRMIAAGIESHFGKWSPLVSLLHLLHLLEGHWRLMVPVTTVPPQPPHWEGQRAQAQPWALRLSTPPVDMHWPAGTHGRGIQTDTKGNKVRHAPPLSRTLS